MPPSPARSRTPATTAPAATSAIHPALASFLVLALALLPTAGSGEENGKDATKASAGQGASENSKSQDNTSGLADIARIIPVGQEQKSVVIPNYEAGQIRTLIHAASMRRLDDTRLALAEMTITTYNDQKEQEMVVNMPTAIYHLESGILEGTSRSEVSRADFDILGDTMLFDSNQNFGRMEGNVRMTIKDSSAIQFDATPTATPTQSAATNQP